MSVGSTQSEELRVLLIEDDEDDFVLTRDLLRQMHGRRAVVDWKADPEEGLALALRRKHDVILVDYRLGAWSGLEIIRRLSKAGCPVPVILLTGDGRENLDIEALQEGATDYLAKEELNPSLLERAVRYAIERKRSGDVLRESEERFRMLANAVPTLIWMTGADDRFVFVNRSWLEFRGATAEEEIGRERKDWIRDCDARAREIVEEAVAARRAFETEALMTRHDGERRWILKTGTPIFLADGEFNGYVGTCLDITDRKAASEQLAEARDEALANARLKSRFLANMTHEIRTPMNGILGMTGLLQQTNLTTEQRELTESVRSSGQSLVRIIDDILDFSRLEAKRLTIDNAPFNLLSIIEDVIELLAESARAKGIELISSVDPGLCLGVSGDSGRLRQILLNLVGNAIKFTERGDVVLAVNLIQEEMRRVTVRIEVSDTGIGMSPETQKHLFTAFMQADSSTTRKHGGTGLGLAISKELVELMKGRIRVGSELGKGSVFRVELPLEKDPEGEHYFERGEPEWNGRRVLVIEDNSEQRAVLARHFSYLGFQPVELAQGSKAVPVIEQEARQNGPFAAVFVNADAPSEEVLPQIRALADGIGDAPTPIVAMPFGFLQEDLEPIRRAGADDFLSKPIRQSQLHPLFVRLFSAPVAKTSDSEVREGASSYGSGSLSGRRFLILAADADGPKALKEQLARLGGYADLIATGSRAIEAIKLFHYEAVFLDFAAMAHNTAAILRQIDDLPPMPVTPPVIGIGGSPDESKTRMSLPLPAEKADLFRILGRCGLLAPIPDESAGTGNRPEKAAAADPAVPAVPAVPETPLDPERLHQIRGLQMEGEDVLGDLLDLLRQEVPHRLRELRAAVERGDREAVGFLVHSIRGVSSNLGAWRMETLCARLREEDAAPAALLDALDEEYLRVEAALERGRTAS